MGRHRRSDAGRAATGRATGVTPAQSTPARGSDAAGRDPRHTQPERPPEPGIAPYLNPEAYAHVQARSDAYLFGTEEERDAAAGTAVLPTVETPAEAGTVAGTGASASGDGTGRGRSHRRRKKAATPVRTGLLGVSAAVALGAVAVATGVLPGTDTYRLGGDSGGDRVQASDGGAANTEGPLGGTSGRAESPTGDGTATSPGTGRSASPSASSPRPSASPTTGKPSEKASEKPSATPSQKPKPTPTPSRTPTRTPPKTTAPVTVSAEAAAEAQVLKLVNDERAKAGCSPVAANSALAKLARDFSADMAARDFFDHTDPSGATPWDRAEKAGITDLGGENIARGQADAAAVMEAWMNSPGHRANILNCEFTTLGVGVHFGPGGPWWTQDFGY
ncbi:CAP domain-containing protein [Streptomyces sp. NPDC052687]|uniref:CAP domain-containing protein n=1 Tax=Streptomyces sp. NPDC052687 TaxID=3154759 RepID=UPI00342AD444